MGSAAAVAFRIYCPFRLLCEVCRINGALARFLLHGSPFIGRPPKGNVAYEVAHAVKTFLVGSARIVSLQAVGPFPWKHAKLAIILLCAHRIIVNGPFVAVVHNQHWHIIIFAFLVEIVDRLWNHITIYDRRAAMEVHAIARELLGIHLAHLLDGFLVQFAHEHQAYHLCLCLVYRTHRRDECSALTDAGTEQTLC